MPKIEIVNDEEIFVSPNKWTRLIKGKRLRKLMRDSNFQMEADRMVGVSRFFNLPSYNFRFRFYLPDTMTLEERDEIVYQIGQVFFRHYPHDGHYYQYHTVPTKTEV